jgi:hypothetical protein
LIFSAEICPQNLQSIERQLRLTDLMTTYLTMLVGFSTAIVVFFVEVNFSLSHLVDQNQHLSFFKMMFRYVNGRKDTTNELTREQGTTRRINVQPSRKLPKASFVQESSKTISPPPAYGEAIKTIFNTQNTIVEGKAGSIESYRTLNGRTYAVVKVIC